MSDTRAAKQRPDAHDRHVFPGHVFLTGFMATGKTTVGRLVANSLQRPFVDLDSEIEQSAGRPISAIFSDSGQAQFRRLEAEALDKIIARPSAVIATGGGAACFGDNLARMRKHGLVVALTAPLDTLRARVADPTTRPLLMQPDGELQDLYESRVPFYRQAHACVRTEDDSADAVARTVTRLVATARAIPDDSLGDASLVALSERAYPILVAAGALARLGELTRRVLGDIEGTVGLVSDSNVAPLYAQAARESLEKAGQSVAEFTVPAGEPSKCFAEFARLTEKLASSGLDRRSAIVALGGGMVGDLAGFAAATLFRGIACIQVPTTILAMVDSAIGGKTGINIQAGKNLVGAFWQPRLVLADPAVLATLPLRECRAAFGELVKYGILDSENLYAAVDDLAGDLCHPEGGKSQAERPVTMKLSRITEVLRRCGAFKSWVVSRDEREQTGERALLNLGHTVGHAIEAAAGYGEMLHGEAVGLGLVAACRVSCRLGLCSPDLETRVTDSLRRAGLDTGVDAWLRCDVLERVGVDKKRTGKQIHFVTIQRVGKCSLTPVEISDLERILRR